MNLTATRKPIEFAFMIGVLLISTITALYAAVWLKPVLVLTCAILHVIATAIALWQVSKEASPVDWKALLLRYWFLLPFLVYAFFSVFWSIHWSISLYRWIILVCTIILAWYFGRKYSSKELQTFLLLFGVLMLVLSAIVTIGDFRQTGEIPSTLRGVFWQKNHTGLFMCFISLLGVLTYIEHFKKRDAIFYLACSVYVATVGGMVWNNSTSAIMSTLILHGSVLALLIWFRFRSKITKTHYRIFGILAILGIVVVLFDLDIVFGLFGRNISLTGRVPMWEQLFKLYFTKHPWFGYGFNAYWYQVSHRMVIGTVSGLPTILISDNGFIDILINNGIIGFVLFLLFYGGIWLRSIQKAWKAKTVGDFTFLLVMIFILLGNLTWSMLFENESMYMLIMLAMMFINDRQISYEEKADLLNPVS